MRTFPPTKRQLQIIQLVARGKQNKEIARELGISHQTVKNHVEALLQRIGANDRAHAVYIALKENFID
jgi:DNA-binding NarL/FixJ family response regulator